MVTKLIATCFFLKFGESILRCSQINKAIKSDYYLMQTCTGSEKNIIARTYADNLDSCKNFTSLFKGLSFNYGDLDNFETKRQNCIVYDCPEFNITALKQYDSMFHYYSLYAKILPSENMTCVPKEGIFMFGSDSLNYTNAASKCEEYGGVLANIITEELSNKVANVLMKFKTDKTKSLQAYVGLNDLDQEGNFLSINGEPLNCISFRSWAPGEPRNKFSNEDCVTIDSNRYWRVQSCNKTFPFVCEILPQGPLDIAQAYCMNIEQQNIRKECFDYYTSTEIEFENDVCNRTDIDTEIIRNRMQRDF